MSSYVPTDWVDDVTPVDAARMDNIEAGLVAAHDGLAALDTRLDAEEAQPDIPPVEDGKWLTGAGGALVWADAPVGGGGAVEYENVWAAATPYQAGDVVEHEGVQYLAVNPSTNSEPAPPAAPSSFTPIPLVTALPTPSFDGQEVILTDSLTAPTYQWRLRYVLAKASNKWVFVGGSPASAYVDAADTITSQSYIDLANVGPSVTVPVTGVYDGELSVTLQEGATGGWIWASMKVGAVATADADGAAAHPGAASETYSVSKRKRIACTAGDVVKLQYKRENGSPTARSRTLALTPVAVGG